MGDEWYGDDTMLLLRCEHNSVDFGKSAILISLLGTDANTRHVIVCAFAGARLKFSIIRSGG